MERNKYRKLIEQALAMPKWERPKPVPVKRTFKEKISDLLTTPITPQQGADAVFDILLSVGATGHTTIADRVPADQLHRQMALEINRFIAEGILRGGLPMNIYCLDRFEAIIDFHHARCLHLYTQLHQRPKEISLASFIVEESREWPKEIEIFTP